MADNQSMVLGNEMDMFFFSNVISDLFMIFWSSVYKYFKKKKKKN